MSRLRVLVVEGDVAAAAAVERQLQLLGHEPLGYASEGPQAVELAHQLKPDVVLVDIRAQDGLDGVAVARAVRERCGASVITMAADADDDTLQRAWLAEPSACLICPFSAPQLQASLEMAHHGQEVGLGLPCQEPVLDLRGHLPREAVGCETSEGVLEGEIAPLRGDVGEAALEDGRELEGRLYQAQRMEALGRLAGGVAHDFNNLLGVILGYVELSLHQVEPSSRLRTNLAQVRTAALRSADLSRQLLAFAHRHGSDPQAVDLGVMVPASLATLRGIAGEGIAVEWTSTGNLGRILVDPSQLELLLSLLCMNARAAIGERGRITISAENRDLGPLETGRSCSAAGSGAFVCLRVTDNGRGLEADTLPHIFEPFFKTPGISTGMVLATVEAIVRQNRGFIVVDSRPGQGTSFAVHLPRLADEAAPESSASGSQEWCASPPQGGLRSDAAGPALPSPASQGGCERETILLVEDDAELLDLTASLLRGLGYHVLAVADPNDALEMAEEHAGPVHLLLSEVVMPQMNGRDLARSVLALHPETRRLFLSGSTRIVLAPSAASDAGVHLLAKPFDPAGLALRVREVLDG